MSGGAIRHQTIGTLAREAEGSLRSAEVCATVLGDRIALARAIESDTSIERIPARHLTRVVALCSALEHTSAVVMGTIAPELAPALRDAAAHARERVAIAADPTPCDCAGGQEARAASRAWRR